MNNSNKEIDKYNDFLHYIHQEMAMYDDLSKNDKYKKDREISKNIYQALADIESKFKEIY